MIVVAILVEAGSEALLNAKVRAWNAHQAFSVLRQAPRLPAHPVAFGH